MNKESKIFVAGHKGLVGTALMKRLGKQGYENIITCDKSKVDLCCQIDVNHYLGTNRPEYVFLCAAKVGGIHANNTYPADFIYSNLQIQNNVIYAAHALSVTKLLFMGSSCIYPKHAPQPMREEFLLSGELEPTNKAYAIAKIAGITMCQSYNKQYKTNFISVMPTNLYGPGDNYHTTNSHVLPAIINQIHMAKKVGSKNVLLWGTGNPKREFLYSDDLADACIHLMNNYHSSEIINIGSGIEVSIRELADIIKDVIGYTGSITFDPTKPDGTPRKLLDCSRIHGSGWNHKTELIEGITKTYENFLTGGVRK